MRDQEVQEYIDGIYPLKGDRWFRIKILDQDKCIKSLRISRDDKIDAEQGYSVQEISCVAGDPGVRKLEELRDALIAEFNQKIEYLKSHYAHQTETQSLED